MKQGKKILLYFEEKCNDNIKTNCKQYMSCMLVPTGRLPFTIFCIGRGIVAQATAGRSWYTERARDLPQLKRATYSFRVYLIK